MNYLVITGVIAGPRLYIDGTDPATGQTVHATIYSGYVQLTVNTAFRGAIRGESTQSIQFFVPESPPFTEAPAALALEMGLRRIQTGGNPGMVTFGAIGETVGIAPDPRGGEHQWLQISFQTPVYEHKLVELNYRVTVRS